jgi:hypothetical protein
MGLVVLLWTGAVSAQVDVYRSVNEHGIVEFSDTRRSDADEYFQLSSVNPAPETIDAHGRLMEQQLELIGLLEESRRARAREIFERRRQNVELARARLALEQERNAAVYEESSRSYGYAYPVGYSYRYQRRYGYRHGYGHAKSSGHRPSHLPAPPERRLGYGGRGGRGGGKGTGHGRHSGSRILIKPFITKG